MLLAPQQRTQRIEISGLFGVALEIVELGHLLLQTCTLQSVGRGTGRLGERLSLLRRAHRDPLSGALGRRQEHRRQLSEERVEIQVVTATHGSQVRGVERARLRTGKIAVAKNRKDL